MFTSGNAELTSQQQPNSTHSDSGNKTALKEVRTAIKNDDGALKNTAPHMGSVMLNNLPSPTPRKAPKSATKKKAAIIVTKKTDGTTKTTPLLKGGGPFASQSVASEARSVEDRVAQEYCDDSSASHSDLVEPLMKRGSGESSTSIPDMSRTVACSNCNKCITPGTACVVCCTVGCMAGALYATLAHPPDGASKTIKEAFGIPNFMSGTASTVDGTDAFLICSSLATFWIADGSPRSRRGTRLLQLGNIAAVLYRNYGKQALDMSGLNFLNYNPDDIPNITTVESDGLGIEDRSVEALKTSAPELYALFGTLDMTESIIMGDGWSHLSQILVGVTSLLAYGKIARSDGVMAMSKAFTEEAMSNRQTFSDMFDALRFFIDQSLDVFYPELGSSFTSTLGQVDKVIISAEAMAGKLLNAKEVSSVTLLNSTVTALQSSIKTLKDISGNSSNRVLRSACSMKVVKVNDLIGRLNEALARQHVRHVPFGIRIIGDSGCGKSVALETISCLIHEWDNKMAVRHVSKYASRSKFDEGMFNYTTEVRLDDALNTRILPGDSNNPVQFVIDIINSTAMNYVHADLRDKNRHFARPLLVTMADNKCTPQANNLSTEPESFFNRFHHVAMRAKKKYKADDGGRGYKPDVTHAPNALTDKAQYAFFVVKMSGYLGLEPNFAELEWLEADVFTQRLYQLFLQNQRNNVALMESINSSSFTVCVGCNAATANCSCSIFKTRLSKASKPKRDHPIKRLTDAMWKKLRADGSCENEAGSFFKRVKSVHVRDNVGDHFHMTQDTTKMRSVGKHYKARQIKYHKNFFTSWWNARRDVNELVSPDKAMGTDVPDHISDEYFKLTVQKNYLAQEICMMWVKTTKLEYKRPLYTALRAVLPSDCLSMSRKFLMPGKKLFWRIGGFDGLRPVYGRTEYFRPDLPELQDDTEQYMKALFERTARRIQSQLGEDFTFPTGGPIPTAMAAMSMLMSMPAHARTSNAYVYNMHGARGVIGNLRVDIPADHKKYWSALFEKFLVWETTAPLLNDGVYGDGHCTEEWSEGKYFLNPAGFSSMAVTQYSTPYAIRYHTSGEVVFDMSSDGSVSTMQSSAVELLTVRESTESSEGLRSERRGVYVDLGVLFRQYDDGTFSLNNMSTESSVLSLYRLAASEHSLGKVYWDRFTEDTLFHLQQWVWSIDGRQNSLPDLSKLRDAMGQPFKPYELIAVAQYVCEQWLLLSHGPGHASPVIPCSENLWLFLRMSFNPVSVREASTTSTHALSGYDSGPMGIFTQIDPIICHLMPAVGTDFNYHPAALLAGVGFVAASTTMSLPVMAFFSVTSGLGGFFAECRRQHIMNCNVHSIGKPSVYNYLTTFGIAGAIMVFLASLCSLQDKVPGIREALEGMNFFTHKPVMSVAMDEKAKTSTAEVAEREIAGAVFTMIRPATNSTVKMVVLDSNYVLIPAHGCDGDVSLNIVVQKNPKNMGGGLLKQEVTIDLNTAERINEDSDLLLLPLCITGARPNISRYFPVNELPKNTTIMGRMIGRRSDGTLFKNKYVECFYEMLQSTMVTGYKIVTYASSSTDGDCGSPYVGLVGLNAVILGFHGGRTDTRTATKRWADVVTRTDLDAALGRLRKRYTTLPAMFGANPPSKAIFKKSVEYTEPHPKNFTNFMNSDGSGVVVGKTGIVKHERNPQVASLLMPVGIQLSKTALADYKPAPFSEKGQMKLASALDTPVKNMDLAILDKCVQDYRKMYLSRCSQRVKMHLCMSFDEVVQTLEMETGAGSFEYRSKSATFKDLGAEEIERRTGQLLDMWAEGESSGACSNDCQKPETLKSSKTEARHIQGEQLIRLIACKILGQNMVEFVKTQPLNFEMAIGLNLDGDGGALLWDYLNHRNAVKKDRNILVDFKEWDRRVPYWLKVAAAKAATLMFQDLFHVGEREAKQLETMFLEIIQTQLELRGVIFCFQNGWSSGNFWTAFLGSIFHSLLVRYAYFKSGNERPFHECVRYVCMSDDGTGTVFDESCSFSPKDLLDVATPLGMIVTTADKSHAPDKLLPFSEVEFLSRKPVYNVKTRSVLWAIKFTSITKMMLWRIPSRVASPQHQALQTAQSALVLAFPHGEKIWNEVRRALIKVLLINDIEPSIEFNRDYSTYASFRYQGTHATNPGLPTEDPFGVRRTTFAAWLTEWFKPAFETAVLATLNGSPGDVGITRREASDADVVITDDEVRDQTQITTADQHLLELLPETLGHAAGIEREVYAGSWEVDTTDVVSFNPMLLLTSNEFIAEKLAHYGALRSKIKIIMRSSASTQTTALYQMVWSPMRSLEHPLYGFTNENTDSHKECAYCMIGNQEPIEFTVDFVFLRPAIRLGKDEQALGTVTIRRCGLVQKTSLTTGTAYFTVHVQFVEPMLYQATAYREAPSDTINKIASAARTVSHLKLGVWSTALEVLADAGDAIGSFARDHGHSRPNRTVVEMYAARGLGHMAVANADDVAMPLGYDINQSVTMSEAVLSQQGPDMMEFGNIAGKNSYLGYRNITDDEAAGTHLMSVTVNPGIFVLEGSVGGAMTTPCVASWPFEPWRGSLVFTFVMAKTALQKLRLQITHDPLGAPPGHFVTNLANTMFFDASEEPHLEVKIDWTSYNSILKCNKTRELLKYDHSAPFDPEFDNGVLFVTLAHGLSAMGTGGSAGVHVFVRMESPWFAVARDSHLAARAYRLPDDDGAVDPPDTGGGPSPEEPPLGPEEVPYVQPGCEDDWQPLDGEVPVRVPSMLFLSDSPEYGRVDSNSFLGLYVNPGGTFQIPLSARAGENGNWAILRVYTVFDLQGSLDFDGCFVVDVSGLGVRDYAVNVDALVGDAGDNVLYVPITYSSSNASEKLLLVSIMIMPTIYSPFVYTSERWIRENFELVVTDATLEPWTSRWGGGYKITEPETFIWNNAGPNVTTFALGRNTRATVSASVYETEDNAFISTTTAFIAENKGQVILESTDGIKGGFFVWIAGWATAARRLTHRKRDVFKPIPKSGMAHESPITVLHAEGHVISKKDRDELTDFVIKVNSHYSKNPVTPMILSTRREAVVGLGHPIASMRMLHSGEDIVNVRQLIKRSMDITGGFGSGTAAVISMYRLPGNGFLGDDWPSFFSACYVGVRGAVRIKAFSEGGLITASLFESPSDTHARGIQAIYQESAIQAPYYSQNLFVHARGALPHGIYAHKVEFISTRPIQKFYYSVGEDFSLTYYQGPPICSFELFGFASAPPPQG